MNIRRKPTGEVINLADLGDSLYEDDYPLVPEPVFTKKIRMKLYKQAKDGTLANPKLWNEIESNWNSALATAEQYGEQIEYTDETVVHEYWYEEVLTSAQQEAYPHFKV